MLKSWTALTKFERAQHVARHFAIAVLFIVGSIMISGVVPPDRPSLNGQILQTLQSISLGFLDLQRFGALTILCGILLLFFRHLTIGWYILVTSPLLIIVGIALGSTLSGLISFTGFSLYGIIYAFLMFIYWVFADGPE